MGTQTQTLTGRTCQRWDSQEPHENYYENPKHFPDDTLDEAANYCRNPDVHEYGVWCYTTDPDHRWDFCFVPHCRQGGSVCITFAACCSQCSSSWHCSSAAIATHQTAHYYPPGQWTFSSETNSAPLGAYSSAAISAKEIDLAHISLHCPTWYPLPIYPWVKGVQGKCLPEDHSAAAGQAQAPGLTISRPTC